MENHFIFIGLIIFLVILFIYFWTKNEHLEIYTRLPGIYELKVLNPKKIKANYAVKLQVIPSRSVNPNHLTLIITYQGGNSYTTKTNDNVGLIYTRYNDIQNVLYRIPENIQYQLDVGNGHFKALTVIYEGTNSHLELLDYEIVKRLGNITTHQVFGQN